MVQSLPGFLNLCLNVCSPCQVLGDVYTEVLEATHPLHRGPTDHKRGVGSCCLFLKSTISSLVLLTFRERERERQLSWHHDVSLSTSSKYAVSSLMVNHSIISKCNNRSGAVRGHTIVCVERVEQGAQDTALWGSYVQGDGVGGELAHFNHLRSAGEEVLNPVTE